MMTKGSTKDFLVQECYPFTTFPVVRYVRGLPCVLITVMREGSSSGELITGYSKQGANQVNDFSELGEQEQLGWVLYAKKHCVPARSRLVQ